MHTQKHRFGFGSMISDSPVMAELFTEAEAARTANRHIFIHGESGVGMHTLARNIQPDRGVELFVATIPETLAVKQLEGAMSCAAGGTLTLTGPEDLSPGLQREVLASIKGPDQSIRWIIISYGVEYNSPLSPRLDPELREALHAFTVRLPPLRERDDDALLLARLFLKQFNATYKRNFEDFSPHTIEVIRRYHWPGNVRELSMLVEVTFVRDTAEQGRHLDLQGGPFGLARGPAGRGLVGAPQGAAHAHCRPPAAVAWVGPLTARETGSAVLSVLTRSPMLRRSPVIGPPMLCRLSRFSGSPKLPVSGLRRKVHVLGSPGVVRGGLVGSGSREPVG